ncbi:MAG: ribonuclease HII [Silvanigrellaceae bacterium]|nr:ribonuclease HII [Silvanigrellaceae bacterium]
MKQGDSAFFYENILFEQLEKDSISNARPSMLIAIDEVGRGCIAGPVVTCASLWGIEELPCHRQFREQQPQNWLSMLKDSKKLSPKSRHFCYKQIQEDFQKKGSQGCHRHSHDKLSLQESFASSAGLENDLLASSTASLNIKKFKAEFFLSLSTDKNEKKIKLSCIDFALGLSTAQEIDRINIWNATQLAILRCLNDLSIEHGMHTQRVAHKTCILMDGILPVKVPKFFEKSLQICVTKADDLFKTVSFSSIIAKVKRDEMMSEFSFLYPEFQFEKNKGYGTRQHFKAVSLTGRTPLHRHTFLPS